MTKEETPPPGTTIVDFELAGKTCSRWFDGEGVVHASGPPTAERAIKAYVQAVARFLPNRVYAEYLCNVRPRGPENDEIKLHAVLELNRDSFIKKGTIGLKIVPDQVTAKVEELKKGTRLRPS